MDKYNFQFNSRLWDFGEEFIEVANYAALPVTGESSKIYVTLDTNKLYRWTGSTYVELSGMTIDANPTDGSANAVSSNGVFDALALKQNSLGFTAEDVANKQTDLTASATKYPTVNAVNTGLGTKQNTLISGTNIRTVNGNTLLGSTDIVINTPPSGLTGEIQFNNGGSFGADSNLFWDNTNKRLGVGAKPASTVRLDVRAQGALSSDIPFRVRNSADNLNIFEVQGTGRTLIRMNNQAFDFNVDGSGNCFLNASNGVLFLNANSTTDSQLVVRSSIGNKCIDIGGTGLGTGTNKLAILNGTAPSTNLTDSFQLYSADITEGNAAPHFRTENGNVIKIYRETTEVASATVVSGGSGNVKHDDTFDGYTVQQVVKALRNIGLLA